MLQMAAANEIESALQSRSGFTSEAFKIELKNLPKHFGIGDAKKLFRKLELDFHKLKPVGPGAHYMFVNFKCEDDREKAILVLDGHVIKGRKIVAIKAKAARDPMLKHRDAPPQEEDKRPAKERISEAVCPLAMVPYDQQLEQKRDKIKEIVENLKAEVLKALDFAPNLSSVGEIASFDGIIASPVLDGYRNKCEFSIGADPDSGETVVGFRLASYRKGSVCVANVDHLPVVSDRMKTVAKHFEVFVRKSGLEAYDNVSQKGVWKQLTVRTSTLGDLLVWVIIAPCQVEDRNDLNEKLLEHFNQLENDKVTSLYVQYFDRKVKGEPEPEPELLYGLPAITESLFGLNFSISPKAFFQVNKHAAEKLFETAADLANLDSETTTLIDVCCGAGTVGLALSSRCRRILGVEIVPEAVINAKANAERNNLGEKTEFHTGRAEFLLPELLRKACDENNSVAIVDPPRAGLHPKAVQALRAAKRLKTLVFISCDPKAAMQNFVNLSRPTSKALPGDPFLPKKAVAVDLFPHTRHFELVILFERVEMAQLLLKN